MKQAQIFFVCWVVFCFLANTLYASQKPAVKTYSIGMTFNSSEPTDSKIMTTVNLLDGNVDKLNEALLKEDIVVDISYYSSHNPLSTKDKRSDKNTQNCIITGYQAGKIVFSQSNTLSFKDTKNKSVPSPKLIRLEKVFIGIDGKIIPIGKFSSITFTYQDEKVDVKGISFLSTSTIFHSTELKELSLNIVYILEDKSGFIPLAISQDNIEKLNKVFQVSKKQAIETFVPVTINCAYRYIKNPNNIYQFVITGYQGNKILFEQTYGVSNSRDNETIKSIMESSSMDNMIMGIKTSDMSKSVFVKIGKFRSLQFKVDNSKLSVLGENVHYPIILHSQSLRNQVAVGFHFDNDLLYSYHFTPDIIQLLNQYLQTHKRCKIEYRLITMASESQSIYGLRVSAPIEGFPQIHSELKGRVVHSQRKKLILASNQVKSPIYFYFGTDKNNEYNHVYYFESNPNKLQEEKNHIFVEFFLLD